MHSIPHRNELFEINEQITIYFQFTKMIEGRTDNTANNASLFHLVFTIQLIERTNHAQ